MKNLERRGIICLLLAACLFVGICIYLYRFITRAGDWVTYPYNSHIYNNGQVASGNIFDAGGNLLIGTKNGKIKWNRSETVRKATAHAVGDLQGNVVTGAETAFRDKLLGYNLITGTYSMNGKGKNITLAINKNISATAYKALAGRNGLVGVYNYRTGEIICMVSIPTFDPKHIPKGKDIPAGTFVNKFLSGAMTPGSIFKLVTSAAAIENYNGLEDWSYTCTGSRTINGGKITCTRPHGRVDFAGALASSCNCGFSELTEKIGAGKMKEYSQKLGLTTQYNIDGVKNAKGSFKFPGYAPLSLAWAGIGQWKDQINPCSMLVYISAIATDGKGTVPRILHKAAGGGEKTEQMIESSTAKRLRDMMKNNVNKEYGQGNFPGLDIYAKSGTAEVGTSNSNAWFAGFIKNSDYPYAFIVCVENGGYGSSVAGPVANTVMQKVISTESAATN